MKIETWSLHVGKERESKIKFVTVGMFGVACDDRC